MRRAFNILIPILLLCPWIMGASGCPNVLAESSDKNSDAALLYQARMLINKREYTEALEAIAGMTATGRATKDGRVVKATALAGRCGLELIQLASEVVDGMGAAQTLFQVLLMSFRNTSAATAWQDCKEAEQTMLGISARDWKPDDYVFLAFVEFAKIGAILAGDSAADANADGSMDGSFDPCTNSSSHIEDDRIQEIGTALTISMASLSSAGSEIAGTASTAFAALCSSLNSVSAQFCNQMTATDFDSNEILALRGVLKSNEIGLAKCGPYGASCKCPP